MGLGGVGWGRGKGRGTEGRGRVSGRAGAVGAG